MSTVWNLLWLAQCVVLVGVMVGRWVKQHRRSPYGRGRHVSLPMVYLLGRRTVRRTQIVLLLSVVAYGFYPEANPMPGLFAAVWLLDDVLTADDDDDGKRFEWSRVKLKMPAPVRLRPVEQWQSA